MRAQCFQWTQHMHAVLALLYVGREGWKMNEDKEQLISFAEELYTIMKLREKYDLHMRVERYVSDDGIPETDRKFIKN